MNVIRLIMLDDLVADHLILDVKPPLKKMLLHDIYLETEGSFILKNRGLEVDEKFERELDELFRVGKLYITDSDATRFYCFTA
ncbi:hypothetical protein HYT57_04120 [Candidatus Woesearchaeota archaeon]|nr:hypothetical protein [Candidatus Woesearchaeota archaeon]